MLLAVNRIGPLALQSRKAKTGSQTCARHYKFIIPCQNTKLKVAGTQMPSGVTWPGCVEDFNIVKVFRETEEGCRAQACNRAAEQLPVNGALITSR
ncbi:uncharacterized [Tachysurus ichikawai]